MLHVGKNAWLLQRRQQFLRVLVASTLSIALIPLGAAAQQGDSKKPNLDPVAATSPSAKSAMGESPSRQAVSAQSLPKPETAKNAPTKDAPAKAASDTTANAPEKSTPPAFPLVGTDALSTTPGVQAAKPRYFPSAIDIHGSTAGVLMHARPDTKYDLLSPLSVWLEDGPLLVSVRHPSEMVLVATKFGDVCVTAGGDALVDRSTDDDTVRIVNLCTNGDTVYLNMHDKLWTASPWAHAVKGAPVEDAKSKKKHGKEKGRSKTYEDIESGAVALAPGYELMIGGHALTAEEVKREDSVGRRDFKTFDGGKFVISEISIDNLTQLHDLIKGLTNHGEKASAIFNDIMKSAGMLKSRQGESGFEKHVPPPPKPPAPKRKPPGRVPPPPAKTSSPSSKPAVPPPSSKPAVPPPAQSNTKSNSSSSKPAVPPPAKQTGSGS